MGITFNRMARLGLPIHDFVLDRSGISATGSLLDLGCGTDPGVAAAHARSPGVALIGLDARDENITQARALLESSARTPISLSLTSAMPSTR